MADFDFGEQAGAMNNFLGQAADQRRKTAQYNALNQQFGPGIAYDPQQAEQAAAADVSMNTIGTQEQQKTATLQDTQAETGQRNAAASNESAQAATYNAALPYVGADKAADIAQKSAAANESNVNASLAPGLARSEVGLRGAQAGEASANARQANVNTGIAQEGQAFLNGASVVGALTTARDQAIANKATDGGSSAIAAQAHNLIPALVTMGVPQDQAEAMTRAAVNNPSSLDQISNMITSHYNAMAQAKGMPVLTPTALAAAAKNFQQTGQPTIAGMGGAKVNTAVLNAAASMPGGVGGVPAAAQNYKAKQTFLNQMNEGSPQSVGGRLTMVNSLAGHMQLLQDFATTMNSNQPGKLQALNAIQAEWKKQTGSAMPTNINAQQQLVAGELTRLYTARGDTEMTREFNKQFTNASSPAQRQGVIDTWGQDIATQGQSLAQQAQGAGATTEFNAHMSPAATRFINNKGTRAPAGPSIPPGAVPASGPNGQKGYVLNGKLTVLQ